MQGIKEHLQPEGPPSTKPALWEKGLQHGPWELGHSQCPPGAVMTLSRETGQFALCLSKLVCSLLMSHRHSKGRAQAESPQRATGALAGGKATTEVYTCPRAELKSLVIVVTQGRLDSLPRGVCKRGLPADMTSSPPSSKVIRPTLGATLQAKEDSYDQFNAPPQPCSTCAV